MFALKEKEHFLNQGYTQTGTELLTDSGIYRHDVFVVSEVVRQHHIPFQESKLGKGTWNCWQRCCGHILTGDVVRYVCTYKQIRVIRHCSKTLCL